MKRVYHSLEELMSSCCNSTLKSHVSSVLSSNQYVKWRFVCASEAGDICRSEFASPVGSTGLTYRLYCQVHPNGERRYSFISGFTPAPAWGNLNA